MNADTPTPLWRDGRVVVAVFVAFCLAVALGSVLLTMYGHDTAPEVPETPREIGHPIVP